ncbi:TPR repeat [Acrodontium crateriforme]|uniref:TPR repeat n=1 Tax=Acrodontium crateriforme TaxID=150365 RepID=A0AAQ3MD19_9PEZI|nr:TPR repeat [Acrodontium crateriforme]
MPDIAHFSDSDESFHSFDDNEPSPPRATQPSSYQHERSKRRESTASQTDVPSKPVVERFAPEEEASLLAESNTLKGSGNKLFGKGSFENAIQIYDKAMSSCPNYLDFEMAVLRSNIAACNLKLEEWKEAIESATKGVDCLERLEPLPRPKPKTTATKEGQNGVIEEDQGDEDNVVEEVDDDVAERIENLQKSGRTLDEVRKLQVKLLMRRAKARTESGGWAALQGADEDYKILLSPVMLPTLSPTDQRSILDSVRKLGPKLNKAKEKEMAEMMSKLKGLGNSLLKPFGLSTENFNFVKDEKSGGYSMNFSQDPKK